MNIKNTQGNRTATTASKERSQFHQRDTSQCRNTDSCQRTEERITIAGKAETVIVYYYVQKITLLTTKKENFYFLQRKSC